MTKSIEEQAAIYQEYYSLNPTCGYHFTQGAKARDAQWLEVVNELREALKEISAYGHSDLCKSMKTIRPNYRCYGEDAEEALTKADQMLKEMGVEK